MAKDIFADIDRQIRETDKALAKIFSNRVKESFLREMRHKVYQYHPDFLMLFDIRFDMIQNAMGTQDNQWDYEVLRNIVGIHRFNTIGKTVSERTSMEKSDSYKKELADAVYEHLKLRNYASPYLRKRQFVEGDEFIYFPVPYKLFVVCMKGLQILNDFKDPYREFYVNIFNKSLAALALIEDNLLDSAYPICRGVIELYIKLLSLVDYPDALEMHNNLVRLEYIKTAQNGENPPEFEELFKNRKNKSQTNQIDYLHYGWVDKIKYFHQIEKNKPYSFNALFDFLKESAPEESKGYFEFLPILYNRCHGFAHGNLGNSGIPLVHYMDLTMILYMVLDHTFRMLCTESKNDHLVNGIDVVELLERDAEKMIHQYNRKSDEMFKTFYNPKGQ